MADKINVTKKMLNPALSKIAGLTVIAVGAAALLGWALDNPALKSFHPSFVSMKANTAAAFLLAGLSLFLKADSGKRPWIANLCAGAATLIGLLTLCEYVLDVDLRIDQVLFREPAGAVLTVIPGRMAPDTAAAFFLTGMGLLCLKIEIKKARPAKFLMLISGLIGLSAILGYMLGTATLYGFSRYTGMALPTALAFVALCAGGLAACSARSGESGPAPQYAINNTDRLMSYVFVLVFTAVSALIVGVGGFYCRDYKKDFRRELAIRLGAIAALRENEIVQYRREHLGDANILFRNSAITQLARRFLGNPGDVDARRQLQAWLDKYSARDQYNMVRLVDADGATRLSSPAGLPPASSVISKRILETLRTGRVAFQDFYLNDLDGRVYLTTLTPILDETDGDRALGAFTFRIDPNKYLYRYIQSWPTPSRSGETLLVRRDGKYVLFLNTLKFNNAAPLKLRIPLNKAESPAVMAALGKTGVVTGRDYRGEPVIADTRAIPGSPWFLVTKIDLSEAYAPMKEHLRMVVYFIGVLLLCAGACMGLMWQMWKTRLLRERNAADAALLESEARYRTIVENIPQKIFMKDRNYKWVSINENLARDLGIRPGDVVGKTDRDLFPRELADKYHADDMRVIETGRTEELEERYIQEGAQTWVNTIKTPVTDGKGEIVGLLGIFWDITERKRMEEQLRESEDRFRVIFERSTVGKALTGADGTLLKVNPAFAGILGYAVDEMALVDFATITHPEDIAESMECIRSLLAGERDYYRMEKRYIHRDGKYVWADVSTTLYRDTDGNPRYFITGILDISETKRITAELAEHRDHLEKLVADRTEELAIMNSELARKNKELEQVVYVASHDLRSPLVNVQGFSKELEYALEELAGILDDEGVPPDIREKAVRIIEGDAPESIRFILSGISRMDSLLTGLLKLSRIGRAAMNIEKLDMNSVVGGILDTYAFQLKEAGAAVEAGDLPPCRGDATQIGQVFANLVGNTLKYLDPARPGKITITGEQRDGHAVYRVEDNGIGIAPEHQEIVFDIFHRLNPDTVEGEGLGLTIVRTIIDKHNGKIRLESEPGKGSGVFVSLPRA